MLLVRKRLRTQLATQLSQPLGPNVYDVSPDVPENCYVDQAAYISRHGSRYPDAGAYAGWVDMQQRFSSANYTVTGELSFIKDWQTVLTNTDLQIAMVSPTGAKEAHDMGYMLRTRYPQLYNEGDDFVVWANNYTRVIQTAKMFVQGYLGFAAAERGSVASVTSTGYTDNIGNSLAPSDQCPLFADNSGGDYATQWAGVYIPPIKERLQALIQGNLTLLDTDISSMPYLCGFESQITGRLSPWCNIFTDSELKGYEYAQDIRYWWGLGPGTDLEQTMMMPYLSSLVGLLQQGPGINGTSADGSSFTPPGLLVSFLNDGQLMELITSTGVFDNETDLCGTAMDKDRLFVTSHFMTMRGTIAFERLNCIAEGLTNTTSYSANATYVRIKLNDAVYTLPSCQNGPGKSCLLSDYAKYISDKYASQGSWVGNCNVTTPGAPTTVQGASFYTDLSSPWLQALPPY